MNQVILDADLNIQVRYQADSIHIDLIELARSGHGLLQVQGQVKYNQCRDYVESQPVTFTTPESHVTISAWNRPR